MEMRNPTRVVFFAADTGRCPAPGEGLFLFQSIRLALNVCPSERLACEPSSWPAVLPHLRSGMNPSVAIHLAQQECHRDGFVSPESPNVTPL